MFRRVLRRVPGYRGKSIKSLKPVFKYYAHKSSIRTAFLQLTIGIFFFGFSNRPIFGDRTRSVHAQHESAGVSTIHRRPTDTPTCRVYTHVLRPGTRSYTDVPVVTHIITRRPYAITLYTSTRYSCAYRAILVMHSFSLALVCF